LQQALEKGDTKGKGTAATVPFPFDIGIKLKKISKNATPNVQNMLNYFKKASLSIIENDAFSLDQSIYIPFLFV